MQEFGSIISEKKKEDRRPCAKNAALLLNVKADLLVGSIHINEPNTITTR